MNPEDLCKKMQEEKKADSEIYYKEEMSSQEYAHKYMGRPGYSVKNTYSLYELNNRNIEEIINQVKEKLGLNSINMTIIINERK